MAVKVFDVDGQSKCARKGIKSGYELLSANGNEINDVLDYRFYCDEEKLNLQFRSPDGKSKQVRIRKSEGCDSLGLSFETYLMDKHMHCKNACIFCFIDQLPPGMRKSLYFKDDDSRLSFLFGNYITLTNLRETDVDRIIKMHISPVNASVHTMNPELRVRMMKNPFAGESLGYLRKFSDAGIDINAQLVLCPGINDGTELEFSLNELSRLRGVRSIAAVPVGLTRFREGLYPLEAYTPEKAAQVIDVIDSFNLRLEKDGREKLAYPADEFYQIAGRDFPDYEYYRDFPQLDNGVGLYVSTLYEFTQSLEADEGDSGKREFAFATGVAAYPLIKKLSDMFCEKFTGTCISGYMIKNRFFGEKVTVAGLITGKDLIDSLKESGFNSRYLLLPEVMLRSRQDAVFLDDVTVEDVERELDTCVIVVSCDGFSLFEAFSDIK